MDKLLEIAALYVEDDDFTRETVLSMLTKKVSRVDVAENGEKGLNAFRSNSFDLIITDIKMPQIDGLTMCREIRSIKHDVHIIITTAYSDLVYLLDAIDIGINQYVIKPVDMSRLFLAIDKCYETINLRRKLQRYHEEREQLIKELQESAQKIKTLGGLLPICASCKKIRDDRGYWEQIETYISTHSGMEFTHCLCPDCMKRLYPQFCK